MADQNTQNNTNNQTVAQVSPSDALIKGHVGFWRTIQGTKMRIVYTTLTGKIKVKSSGIFLNFPWRLKPVEISLDKKKIDTPERTCNTLGVNGSTGPQVSYDTDYYVSIVDSAKFMDAVYSHDGQVTSAEVRRFIADKVDQITQDFIRTHDYQRLIASKSVDMMATIGQKTNGSYPAGTLNAELLDTYGVEISAVTFVARPPKTLLDEATRTKVEEQKKLTAAQEQERLRVEAEGKAERMGLMATAEAKRVTAVGRAEATAIGAVKGADPTQVALAKEQTKQAQAYAQGTATVYAFQGGQPGMMMGMPGMYGQPGQPAAQTVGQPGQQQSVRTQPSRRPVDWSILPDSEYLTAEDSAQLAAERGASIAPGGRYHISYLSDEEKQRYKVAAEKGKTK